MSGEKNTALMLLQAVQLKLKAPKNNSGQGGYYNYRNAEQIYQAAKPLLQEQGLGLICTDEIVAVGGRLYIKAEARVYDIATGDTVSAYGYAREPETLAKMSAGQITGASSSYARKYAMCGLFCVDGSEDEDEIEAHGLNGYGTPAVARQSAEGIQSYTPAEENAEKATGGAKNGNGRDYWLKQIMAQATQQAIPNEVISAVIKRRYNKSGGRYLKVSEAQELAENFDKLIVEYEESQQ